MNGEDLSGGSKRETDAHRIRRIAALVLPLCVFAVFLAALVVSFANDIYAFVKPEGEKRLYISYGSTLYSVAQKLEDEGIISNPAVFSLYASRKGGRERIEGFSGEIELRGDMSYREILSAFSENMNKDREGGEQ